MHKQSSSTEMFSLPPTSPTAKPAKITEHSLISTDPCLSLLELSKNSHELTQIHCRLVKLGLLRHPFALTRLMAAFALSPLPSTNTDHAQSLFDRDENPNSFSYNVMIRSYSSCNRPENAISMFRKMLCDGNSKPNKLTFPFVLKACSRLNAVEEGRQVHGLVFKHGMDSDLYVQNALIAMYMSAGCVVYAHMLFERISRPDVVSWNSMSGGLVGLGLVEEARELFDRMPEKNVVSWNCLIDGYVKSGLLEAARVLFDQMPVKDSITWNIMVGGYAGYGQMEEARELFDRPALGMKDLVTFNVMIDGYVKDCRFKEVLELFTKLQLAKIEPDNFTLVSTLAACSYLGALDQGKWIHSYIDGNEIEIDAILGTALIDMYSKCGEIKTALSVFKGMEERDVGAWNSIISGLGVHGYGREALNIFSDMLESDIAPDEITFVSILSACRHSVFVGEGCKCFKLMTEVYGFVPKVEHYGCMVDLLCRKGLLDEAKGLIEAMNVNSSVPMWGALLGACSRLGNVEMGEYAAKQLLELDPGDTSCYVVLSNMYAAAGRWDDAVEVRKQMKKIGMEKAPGCSSIEVHGIVHEFHVGSGLNPVEEMDKF